MRHTRIERWSLLPGPAQRLHPVARILAALAVLIAIATLGPGSASACALYFTLLAGAAWYAGLPVLELAAAAAVVLPFALTFAVIVALSGDSDRAALLVARSYLSALTTLLLTATTPLPALFAGLEALRVPRFLLLVMQFLYRYLIVLAGEATAMRDAAKCRSGQGRAIEFRHAAAALGVLFARSYARAQSIHAAMISRGFTGHLPRPKTPGFASADAGFVLLAAIAAVTIRIGFA